MKTLVMSIVAFKPPNKLNKDGAGLVHTQIVWLQARIIYIYDPPLGLLATKAARRLDTSQEVRGTCPPSSAVLRCVRLCPSLA